MTPILCIEQLDAFYGQAQVLQNITLRVHEGECVALLGRNGAGKTSLLHCLFNIGPNWAGRIEFKQQNIASFKTHRIANKGLALVPQGRGVFPSLTVQESLLLANLRKRADVATNVELTDIYRDMPRLHERRNALCSSLSGGERQLLALGRALLTQARFLVLDEPSEGLAPMTIQNVVLPQLRRLIDKGYTLLLAEQNTPLALGLAQRAVVLLNGRCIFDAPVEQFREDAQLQQQALGISL